MKDYAAELTSAQLAAVTQVDGPLIVLAGPGSGKTRVVTYRIAYLLDQGISPRQILSLTFTNKAAEEMQRRVQELTGLDSIWMGTFHRFCAQLLRRYAGLVGLRENFSIYDVADAQRVLDAVLKARQLAGTHITLGQLSQAISRVKNRLQAADGFQPRPGDPVEAIVGKVLPHYQQQLLAHNAVDFDDLLLHVVALLRENESVRDQLDQQYRYVLVDEYQDTNLAQYTIARALSMRFQNLAVTGDPDQSIYGWRGAHPDNIRDFERDFPGTRVVRLEQNYRSTPNIVKIADQLIANNVRRKPKSLFTERAPGDPVRLVRYLDQRAEAEGIAETIASGIAQHGRRPRDFAIIYRINALSRVLEFALQQRGIPYQLVNSLEFYQRKEIKDVLAYLRLLNNPRDDVALQRVFGAMTRGIGDKTWGRLAAQAFETRLGMVECLVIHGVPATIHKSAATALRAFSATYHDLQKLVHLPVAELIRQVLLQTGYWQELQQSNFSDDRDRCANLEELITAAQQFDQNFSESSGLEEFLQRAALTSDTDAWGGTNDRVSLMTLHATKGLEFPCVFAPAIEHGILPHERSDHDLNELEEERRLLFVGITRAMDWLQLSYVRRREFRGRAGMAVPSSFLLELPREEMHFVDLAGTTNAAPGTLDGEWDDETIWLDAEVHEDEYVDALDPDLTPTDLGESPPGARTSGLIMTARELSRGPEAPPTSSGEPAIDPDYFQPKMIVRHPEYGLGRVLTIHGSGRRRTATIHFFTLGRQHTFYLAHSQLRPLG